MIAHAGVSVACPRQLPRSINPNIDTDIDATIDTRAVGSMSPAKSASAS